LLESAGFLFENREKQFQDPLFRRKQGFLSLELEKNNRTLYSEESRDFCKPADQVTNESQYIGKCEIVKIMGLSKWKNLEK
jgi:hypothetical protein